MCLASLPRGAAVSRHRVVRGGARTGLAGALCSSIFSKYSSSDLPKGGQGRKTKGRGTLEGSVPCLRYIIYGTGGWGACQRVDVRGPIRSSGERLGGSLGRGFPPPRERRGRSTAEGGWSRAGHGYVSAWREACWGVWAVDSRLRGNEGGWSRAGWVTHAPDMVTYRRGERLAGGVWAVDSRLRGNDGGGRLLRVGGHAPDMVTYRRGERLAEGVRAVDSRLRGNDGGRPSDAGGWSRMAMTRLRKPVPARHAPDTGTYRRGERVGKGVRAVDSRLRGNDRS